MKAIWNDQIIAESKKTIELEGDQYFPTESIMPEVLKPTQTTTICPLKGEANYYDIHLEGKINKDAAWTYIEPSEGYEQIKGHIAFLNTVEISE